MPFLTSTQIASDLPNGFNTNLVNRLLVRLELDLKSFGLVFIDPTATTQNIKGENGSYCPLLDFTLARTITAVNLKYLSSDSSSLLIQDVDYSLVEHPNLVGYYYRIEMIRQSLRPSEYLSMTAKFGCFIDFSNLATLDQKANLLYGIVIDFIVKQLRFYSSDFQQIVSSETGDTKVQFRAVSNSTYNSSITSDSEFRSALNYFATI